MARKKAAKRKKKRGPPAPPVPVTITVETRKVADLRPNPDNAKTHPPEQVRALAASIKEFGVPKLTVVVDERDVLLAGHGMRLGMIEASVGDVQVNVVRGWSPARKRAFLEADNRLGELSGWDQDKRRLQLQQLASEGFPMLAIGWETGLAEFIAEGAPPTSFPSIGEDLETEHECPKCGYKWSGKPRPAEAEEE